jgi:hypothetical protein
LADARESGLDDASIEALFERTLRTGAEEVA